MALEPEIDLVLHFVPTSSQHGQDTNPREELSSLITTLASGGLNVTARPAVNGAHGALPETKCRPTPNSTHAHGVYVFVSAPHSKLAELYNAQTHADFLLGIPAPSWRIRQLRSNTGDEDPSKFSLRTLPPADRIRLVYEYVTSFKGEAGLGVVVAPSLSGSASASYLATLRYPSVKSIFALHNRKFNRRWFESWTRQRRGFHISFSELCNIRDEFGEGMAYYFAFLSSYTVSLFIPASLGLLFWFTSSPYSLLFSSLLTLWSMGWIEWWRIRERIIAVRWGTLGSFKAEKRRVGFIPEKKIVRVKNGTMSEFDDLDAAFPWYKRELRVLASVPIIMVFGALLAAVLSGIFVLEAFVTRLYHGPGSQYISLFPTVLFTLFIPIFLNFYNNLATRLTNWENHAHESEFNNSLTLKLFALSSIVAYLGLALSAFLYVPFGDLIMILVENAFNNETQGESNGKGLGRLKEWGFEAKQGRKLDTDRLQNQMFAYTVTNQVVNTLQEVVLPYILRGIERYRSEAEWNPFGRKESPESQSRSESRKRTPERKLTESERLELTIEREWESELLQQVKENALLPEYTLFGDYAEMVTQFGYVALWSTIWPLTPVMAFLNNWFEMRSDAFKIMTHSRRPLPMRVESIGAWLDCMAFISWLGTLTNVALVYLFHPEKHADLSSRFGTTLQAAAGSIGEGTQWQAAHSETHARTHLEMHIPTTYGDFSSTITSTWQTLLMPALLVTLASSHGYILLRAGIRHVVQRAVWRGSKEKKEIERVGEMIKEAYLGQSQARRNVERQGKDIGVFAFPSNVKTIGVDVNEVASDDQKSNAERFFWERDLDEAGVWSAISRKED